MFSGKEFFQKKKNYLFVRVCVLQRVLFYRRKQIGAELRYERVRKTYNEAAQSKNFYNQRMPMFPTKEKCLDYEQRLQKKLDLCRTNVIIEARKPISSDVIINGQKFMRGNYLSMRIYDDFKCWETSEEVKKSFQNVLLKG